MFVLATNVEWHEVGIGKGWLKINIKNHIFGGSLQSKLQFAQQFNAKKWLAGFWAALHGFLFYGPLKRIFARPIVAFVSPPNKSPFGAIFPVFVEAKKTVVVGWSTHWPCASFVCQLSKVPKRISCGRQKGVQEKTTQLVCKVVEEALLGLLVDIAIRKKWLFGAILREICCRICIPFDLFRNDSIKMIRCFIPVHGADRLSRRIYQQMVAEPKAARMPLRMDAG